MAEGNFIGNDWWKILEDQFSQDYFWYDLRRFLDQEYDTRRINPERRFIYQALELTPFENVKVVIVGQDPCPGLNQAFGVAFSVPFGTETPNTVINIYKELENDLGYAPAAHGCLESWARQGVLLLNSILTVRQGQGMALSHRGLGWETFTDAIIQKLSDRKQPVFFILWGNLAAEKMKLIDNARHGVLRTSHPAASFYDENQRDFFGSNPFSITNAWLENNGLEPINWELPQGEEQEQDEVGALVDGVEDLRV